LYSQNVNPKMTRGDNRKLTHPVMLMVLLDPVVFSLV